MQQWTKDLKGRIKAEDVQMAKWAQEKTVYSRSWQISLAPLKGQIVNILYFTGHTVSVATVILCQCLAIDNTQMNEHGCASIELYGSAMWISYNFQASQIWFKKMFNSFKISKNKTF